MRLSQVLAAQVSNKCRSRGGAYFMSGAVHDLRISDGAIVATVVGGDEYDVTLEQNADQIRATCTCPYFVDRLEICKHIWATVLAAEAKGLPLIRPGPAPASIEFEPVSPLGADDAEMDDFLETTAAGRAWSPPVRPAIPRPKREPPAPWRQFLAAVTAPRPDAGATSRPRLAIGQLIYVVDVAATVAAGLLVVELMTRDRKASGDWSKPRPARVSPTDIRVLPEGDDRHILERMRGARPQFDYAGYYESDFGAELSRMRISGVLVREIVPLLCATGRAFARIAQPPAPQAPPPPPRYYQPPRKPDPSVLLPLAWDAGAPWRFTVVIRHDESVAAYTIEGSLTRADARMDVSDPSIVLADGVLVTQTHAASLDHGGAFTWLAAMRRTGRVTVPQESRSAIVDALLTQPPPLVEAPDELRIDIVDGEPRPGLRLRTTSRADRLAAELTFEYDGTSVTSVATEALVRGPETNRAIRRNIEQERRHAETLHRVGCRMEWQHEVREQTLQLPAASVARAVRTLLVDGWHVEGAAGIYRRPGAVSVSVSSGIDWFDLQANVDYDGRHATLPQLLSAVERGESFITLGDGSIGLLPDDWLRTHALIARVGTADGDHVRFKAPQVALLDALLEAQPHATWDETYARARREIQRFEGVRPLDPPATFAGTLRGYQREGLGWLVFLQQFGFGGCLADDMGLGKTVMVLALLDMRRERLSDVDRRPSLVVAPRSVVFNWLREAERFTPRLRVLDYTGTGRAAAADRLANADLVLTTYGTLRRDAAALAGRTFDYVVLDESQAIKNAGTASAKAARLLNARFRLALSGTPIENHLGELRSLFDFLNPGLFGRSLFSGTSAVDEESLALLSRGLRPFILRRTKEQVAAELPPKLEQTLDCELEKPQRALYNELRDHYRRTLLADSDPAALKRKNIQVLEALLRLRQAACHPGLIDRKRAGGPSAKLDVLIPRLRETIDERHKALVFSQFTSLLAIVRRELDAQQIPYEYLDGRTRDREARVDRFQNDAACPLFLVSLKAGGVGLNLTAADYVFLLDPWWNPAVEAQAIDRTHRIGQMRHVFAYRLIARDTVEERVLELQQRKRHLADAILTATAAPLANLRREDLELLLS
jgi:superfamily II DNA or RNA helicase